MQRATNNRSNSTLLQHSLAENEPLSLKAIQNAIIEKIMACNNINDQEKIINTIRTAIHTVEQNASVGMYFPSIASAANDAKPNIDHDFYQQLISQNTGFSNEPPAKKNISLDAQFKNICNTPALLDQLNIWLNNLSNNNIYYGATSQINNNLNASTNIDLLLDQWVISNKSGLQYIKAKIIILECYNNKSNILNLTKLGLDNLPDRQVFIQLTHVEIIDVSKNQLTYITNTFSNMKNLKELYFRKNNINKIMDNSFVGSDNILVLSLPDNEITNIKLNTFFGLINLKKLYLSYNQIINIETGSFARLPNLKKLDLSHNQINLLENYTFRGLANLKVLELHHNQITHVSHRSFAGLTNLDILDLFNNKIYYLKKNPFHDLNLLSLITFDDIVSTADNKSFIPHKWQILKTDLSKNYFTHEVSDHTLSVAIKKYQIIEDYIKLSDLELEAFNPANDEYLRYLTPEYQTPEDGYKNILKKEFRIIEDYCLHLLIYNQLQEPEAIRKLATRFAAGKINISDTKQGIEFIVKLFSDNQLPLLKIITENLNYFITQDGESKLNQIIWNNLIIYPAAVSNITQQLQSELTQALQKIKADINQEVLENIATTQLYHNNFKNVFAQSIIKIIKDLWDINFQPYNLKEEGVSLLTGVLQRNQDDESKYNLIRYYMQQILISKHDKPTEQFINALKGQINQFINELKLNVKEYLSSFLITNFCIPLQIHDTENQIQAIAVLEPYIKWTNMVNEKKSNDLISINQQICGQDLAIKNISPSIYHNYIISTLPYRNMENIQSIMNDSNIPLFIRHQLELVEKYYKQTGIDDPQHILSIFIVKSSTTKEYCLVTMADICYLNIQNIKGFKLEEQLKLFKLQDTQNFTSEEISTQNYPHLIMPDHLHKLIANQFTFGNIIAKNIVIYMRQLIQSLNLKFKIGQYEKFEEIVYQVALTPDSYITISLDYKKQLMESFADNDFIKADGEFVKLEIELRKKLKIKDNESIIPQVEKLGYLTLSNLLIAESGNLTFAAHSNELLNYFSSVESKNKPQETVLCYLLGVIFMNMSSINVLGYHNGNDNRAFARFRLMGAYWLAQSIVHSTAEKKWNDNIRKKIANEISNAIFTDECSGQIANSLYGKYCAEQLNDVYQTALKTLSLLS